MKDKMTLQDAFDAGFGEVKGYIDRSFAAFEERIAALENRFAEVERRGIRYRGVYQRASDYASGDCVTNGGSMFIAIANVPAGAKPGEDDHWQLAVKAGRDAR